MDKAFSEDRTEFQRDQQDPLLRIHSVAVFVRDQDRSLAFYLDKLKFNLVGDMRLESGERWVAVAPPDGSAILTLVAPKPESREYKLIGRPMYVAFVTEDIIAKFHEWRKRGVRFSNTPRLRRIKYAPTAPSAPPADSSTSHAQQAPVWGAAFTRFKDVDGNSFALVSYDQVIREIETQRRAAAEKLESERRAAQELEIARQVQARLFPQSLPAMRTLDYAGICIQARQVGGDYYDFLDLGHDRLGLVVGDIAGKGIAASLLMANLQANLRSQCAIALDEPQRFLQSVNRLFYENTDNTAYATLFFAEYHEQSRRLRYANCGHLPGLVLRRDHTLERLESTCTVLGLFKEWNCAIQERRLESGDTFVLYTDGVSESFDAAGEEFGEQRLIEALRRGGALSSEAVLASIVDEVRRFSPLEQHDDITLIVARCRDA